jgi:two-component system, OmpR family, sensor histidine kinase ChvG
MSFALVIIPWFGYLYLSEMEDFLVDSQANAQLLTAEGISTLLNGRTDLFYELPLSPEGYEQLYAHPLKSPIRIDGRNNDWEEVLEYSIGFGTLDGVDETDPLLNQFYLVLGEHNDQIYALVTVKDDALVFRDRNILRLDLSDHLRITFTGQDETIKKVVLTMTEPGVTTAYLIDNDWRYAIQGEPENRIPGFMTKVDDGYAVEFRIPLELLGSTRQFGLAVVDVDNPETRAIESITGTLPSAGREAYGLVLLKSPEVLRIIEGLGYSGANIQVIDAQRRVRAEVGSYEASPTQEIDADEDWTDGWFSMVGLLMDPLYDIIETNLRASPLADDKVIKDSLAGRPTYQRRYSDEDGEVIVAAHPIIAQNEIIGTVLLKQNTKRILELRRDALQRIVSFSVVSLLIFVALILVFSLRLASRIRKLESEATSAIDVYGRLKTNQLTAETQSGDEIGDLARSISGMLSRLHQHNQFLENMPRTLRHEINNPLNTLSTSLQNLEVEESEEARQKYLDAAKRGVTRIGMIVQNLADAASLEDALAAEELEIINLYELVQNYLTNCRTIHADREFKYQGINEGILTEVSDFRVEQLLDKLIDNAIDFSDPGSTITVGINADARNLTLFVTNQGPVIADDMVDNVFDSMFSIRESNTDNRLHFGMGLYVVRIIAEHHRGSVKATNLFDGKGVSIKVMLPIYLDSKQHKGPSAAN